MNSTNASQVMVDQWQEAMAEAQRSACLLLWDGIMQAVSDYWFYLVAVTVVLLIAGYAQFRDKGRWGILGRVLYRLIYLSLLCGVISLAGPEVMDKPSFAAICFVVYVVSFEVVGVILRTLGAGMHGNRGRGRFHL